MLWPERHTVQTALGFLQQGAAAGSEPPPTRVALAMDAEVMVSSLAVHELPPSASTQPVPLTGAYGLLTPGIAQLACPVDVISGRRRSGREGKRKVSIVHRSLHMHADKTQQKKWWHVHVHLPHRCLEHAAQ